LELRHALSVCTFVSSLPILPVALGALLLGAQAMAAPAPVAPGAIAPLPSSADGPADGAQATTEPELAQLRQLGRAATALWRAVEDAGPVRVALFGLSPAALDSVFGAGPAHAEPDATRSRLPAEAIQAVVRWNAGRFRGCYVQGLVQTPRLEGRIAVRFVIGAEGGVSRAEIADTELPLPVSQCMADAFRALRFAPSAAGAITVTYPFRLSREGASVEGIDLRPNRKTSWAGPSPSSAATAGPQPAAAPSREEQLFRLFAAGAQSPAPPGQAPAAQAPSPTDGSSSTDATAGAPSTTAAPSRCAPGDPLCSDIDP